MEWKEDLDVMQFEWKFNVVFDAREPNGKIKIARRYDTIFDSIMFECVYSKKGFFFIFARIIRPTDPSVPMLKWDVHLERN